MTSANIGMAMKSEITFSFGKNWQEFLSTVDEDAIIAAGEDIEDWLGTENIRGKSIVDIGSGSGLSSLCMYYRGCRRLVSFDCDPHSVETTKLLAKRARPAENWEIFEGSILDEALVARLGTFDIVHSWGVLHHTGNMWQAIDNAIRLCAPNAFLFIAIYTGGDRYEEDLALKRRFNAADESIKAEMVRILLKQWSKSVRNASGYSENIIRVNRGMTLYHDVVDWLGGLPYEVADVSEILLFGINRGLRPLRVCESVQGDCSVYLFKKDPNRGAATGEKFAWSSKKNNKQEERNLERQLSEDLLKAYKTVQRPRSALELRRDLKHFLNRNARRCLGVVRQRLFLHS
jgi:2-polyprenyl-6-hydroxyphenyl methylase/3-demethylubiquinone-9 3-methyltransferase